MAKNFITPVVLCGGSGTRLWPLSRKSFPKQFAPLIENKSLLHLTLERVRSLNSRVLCVTSEEHRFLVAESIKATGMQGRIVLEPVARNTAAAMALAALVAAPDDLLLFCPADHHIPDHEAFVRMVEHGRASAEAGEIVTFGVFPSFPTTAYGYIEHGAAASTVGYQVARFIEKPAKDKVEELLLRGNVLWNAGIFLMRADTLIQSLRQYAADILEHCKQAVKGITQDSAAQDSAAEGLVFLRPDRQSFLACRSESIDYAVMEHHRGIVVVPFAGTWSDVGSWNAVANLTSSDQKGNRIEGRGLAVQATETFIHAPHRQVVALGTTGLLIIDTPDALLVADRSYAESVKQVVAELELREAPEAAMHRKVARPWGWYDSIDRGDRFQVKRITVKPGASLSLQKHHHRAEHWIVVSGTAEVTRGDETFLLTENQSTYIPIGEVHRLKNPGNTELQMIEVQSGSYLGEDDIVRLDDVYGRSRQ